jgi:hypothetical protein
LELIDAHPDWPSEELAGIAFEDELEAALARYIETHDRRPDDLQDRDLRA